MPPQYLTYLIDNSIQGSATCTPGLGGACNVVTERYIRAGKKVLHKSCISPFLIIPNAPEESLLYLSVDGRSVNIMPPPYGNTFPLSENQVNGIKTWIEEGAEAN